MTLQSSLSESLIKDENDTVRWQNIPHSMTDWGKILKVYRADSELMLHLDGYWLMGQFYFFMFDFQHDLRFEVSEKTTAFEFQPSKN